MTWGDMSVRHAFGFLGGGKDGDEMSRCKECQTMSCAAIQEKKRAYVNVAAGKDISLLIFLYN